MISVKCSCFFGKPINHWIQNSQKCRQLCEQFDVKSDSETKQQNCTALQTTTTSEEEKKIEESPIFKIASGEEDLKEYSSEL